MQYQPQPLLLTATHREVIAVVVVMLAKMLNAVSVIALALLGGSPVTVCGVPE